MQQRLLGFSLFALLVSACGNDPQITNTTVSPSSFTISGLASTPTFTVTTDVLHLGGTITAVKASVENQSITIDLAKEETIAGGERWQGATQTTLWTGVSAGTYEIDITATNSAGTTVTQAKAASVQISD